VFSPVIIGFHDFAVEKSGRPRLAPFLILSVSNYAGAELDKSSNFGYGEDKEKAI